MKVVFYNPRSSAGRKPVLPLSLLAVGAVLEGRFPYVIIDGNLEDDPLEALDAALRVAGSSAVLALTVMPGPQLEEAVPLCRELKGRFPETPIVWGGYFPSQHWDVCLRAGYVDYVVRGHGEAIFLQLLTALETGSVPERVGAGNSRFTIDNQQLVPGLAYRDESGTPVTNPMAPIPRPADLPQWNLDRVDVARYVRRTFLGKRTLGYHSSYGCPFFCNFCAVVNMVGGRWFPQTAETVAEAVAAYKRRWNVDAVEFYDNNFFTQQARVAEFSERILGMDIAWWGEGRIDTMQMYSSKSWELMRDAGLKMVFMGAESGSDETLKRMDKGGKMSTKRTLEMAELMRSYDIVPEFSFVLGNPPDPEEDMRKTIEFIREVKKVNPAAEIIMYLYTPVPLSGELYEQAKAEGFAFPETLEGWISKEWLDFSQRRSETLPWIKRGLQEQMLDFERVINAYYPTSTNAGLSGLWRALLRGVSAWRYHSRFYHFPIELRAMHRLVAYQRPETSGF